MNQKYMEIAIKEADKALKSNEMPVGSVIIYKDKIIGKGYNKKECKKNSLMHAEMIAINSACKKNKDWRLNDCELYVTMEPCVMCMGAIIESRIKTVYYGVENKKTHNMNIDLCNKEKIGMIKISNNKINEQLDFFFSKIREK